MSKKYRAISLSGQRIYYDTPFATKTFLTGIYDFFCETKKASILNNKPVIVDIGANIGQYLYAARTFYPKSTIYSFEPDPEIFRILKKNFPQDNRTVLFNIALSDINSKVNFYKSKQFSEWSTIIPHQQSDKHTKIIVKSIKGDRIFSNIKEINLLKIDVEGAELMVIKGLKKTLKNVEYLLIETTLIEEGNHTNELLKILCLENNFRIVHIGRIFYDDTNTGQRSVDILFKNNLV